MPAGPDYFAQPERIQATPRSQQIARLRLYYEGKQYDGRPDWWSGEDGRGNVVPLRERKPCIIYPLPKAACNQATRFTFGEGRFPAVAVAHLDEDDDEAEDENALAEEDAKTVTAYLAHVIEVSRLKSAMRRLLRIGLSQRSAVAVLGVRRGRFTIDMPRPQDCWVEFIDDDPEGEVKRMTWAYPFQKEILQNDRVVTETYYFRRDYTDTEIVFYHDAKLIPGKDVEWQRDEARTKQHGLGFCPVRWIRNLPAEDCDDIDGVSVYDGLEDELDALNFSLSQRHRGIHYFGTPQAFEVGVSDDETPGEVARTSRPTKGSTPGAPRQDPYQRAGAPARKTAPDQIWSYKNEKALAALFETTGKAFEATSKHVLDIRSRLLEAMDVVLMDSSEIAGKGELSAKALAMMYAPLLALVDELRDCWWATGLAPILGMVLRITVALGGVGILAPQSRKVAELCRRFLVDFPDPQAGTTTLWIAPKMLPSWGPYFSPTNAEVGELVLATSQAKDAGLISEGTAKRNVASCFGEADTNEDKDDEAAPPATSGDYDDDMDALHMDTHDDARRLLLPSPMLAKLHVARLGRVADADVWAVDGNAVRLLDIDFTDAGNPARYVYIPEGELWVEERITANPADLACDIIHEAVECAVMLEGVPYESAHCAACAMEEILRKAFASGVVTASSPAEALSIASTWLPGLTRAAQGLAKAHAARPKPLMAPATTDDQGPPSERAERPGEPDPDSTRTPAAKPAKPPTKTPTRR